MEIHLILDLGNNIYFFLLVYTLLGAGIKYIDAAYDEKTVSKKAALVIAPVLGLLWAYAMLINLYSATILLAILLGVFLKRKIDNYAFLLGFFIILVIIIPLGIELMLLPLVFLTTAAVLDELGNDFTDNNKKNRVSKKFSFQLAVYFFGRRYLMKTALVYLVLLGVYPWYFLLALIFFDEAYLMMHLYSKSRLKTSKA
jgi:hypothetical protein